MGAIQGGIAGPSGQQGVSAEPYGAWEARFKCKVGGEEDQVMRQDKPQDRGNVVELETGEVVLGDGVEDEVATAGSGLVPGMAKKERVGEELGGG